MKNKMKMMIELDNLKVYKDDYLIKALVWYWNDTHDELLKISNAGGQTTSMQWGRALRALRKAIKEEEDCKFDSEFDKYTVI